MKQLIDRINESIENTKSKKWKGSLGEYLEKFFSDPERLINPEDPESRPFKLCQRSAHAYVKDMLIEGGVRYGEDGEILGFDLIDKILFGVETLQRKLYEFLNSATLNMETRKRLPLIYGPPGSGKSELVRILKRGLEAYNRTQKGAVYAIEDCPINENPLNAIPYAFRDQFREKGINIDGTLCPDCTRRVEEILENGNLFEDVKVKQVYFSEILGKGIETVRASEIRRVFSDTQDEETSIFKKGNRGIVELEDTVLKDAKKSIDILLSLTEEKKLGQTYLDELLILTANEEDIVDLLQKKKSLLDRIHIIEAPYNTKPSEEKRIYEKFLKEETDLEGVHMAPHSLDLAALFGTMTRVSTEISAEEFLKTSLKKVLFYDQVDFDPSIDIKKIREEARKKGEGMFGVSPRFVNDRIIAAIISSRNDNSCVSPIRVLKELEKGFTKHKFGDSDIKAYKTLLWGDHDTQDKVIIEGIIHEYERMAKEAIQKAFYKDFEKEMELLLGDYIKNVKAYLDGEKIVESHTMEEHEPDENLMSDIEEFVGILEDKKKFRNRAFLGFQKYKRESSELNEWFARDSDRKIKKAYLDLKKGAKQYLFDERSHYINALTSRNPTNEEKETIDEIMSNLRQGDDYCPVCSAEVMKYATILFKKEEEQLKPTHNPQDYLAF